MITVLDASVLVVAFNRSDTRNEAALNILGHECLVPVLGLIEAANGFRKTLGLPGSATVETAAAALASYGRELMVIDERDFVAGAFEYAVRLHHPVQDCTYLALAVQFDGVLATFDLRFARKVWATDLRSYVQVPQA